MVSFVSVKLHLLHFLSEETHTPFGLFFKRTFCSHSCCSDTRCQEASDPTRISVWRYWGQRGHLKISQSQAGSTPSLKYGSWLIGLSFSTVLSFGLSICQKRKKKASFLYLIFTKLSQQNMTKAGCFSTMSFFSLQYLSLVVLFSCLIEVTHKTKIRKQETTPMRFVVNRKHTHTHTHT